MLYGIMPAFLWPALSQPFVVCRWLNSWISCRPSAVDSLFAQHAQLQYTRQLLFSDVVHLMSLVVCGIRPSINAALN